ncbi:MAG TPA: hypothetical protein VFK66_09045 [Oryzihumus sp.]|nr:hypothetical protein [Oryzihumus sp.]
MATFLLAGGSFVGAFASPASAAPPVDLRAHLVIGSAVPQGASLWIDAGAELVSGTASGITFTVTLPSGTTYVPPTDSNDLELKECRAGVGGRSVTCTFPEPLTAPNTVAQQLEVRVGSTVAPGTRLTFTNTVSSQEADATPEDNTKSGSVLVGEPDRLTVTGFGPTRPVATGEPVTYGFVVRNGGTHTANYLFELQITRDRVVKGIPFCGPDIEVLECTPPPLAAGQSQRFAVTVVYGRARAGTALRLSGRIVSVADVNNPRHTAYVTLRFASAPATGAARPPSGPTSAAPAKSRTTLPVTGPWSIPLTGVGVALVLLGAVLVPVGRRAPASLRGGPGH